MLNGAMFIAIFIRLLHAHLALSVFSYNGYKSDPSAYYLKK